MFYLIDTDESKKNVKRLEKLMQKMVMASQGKKLTRNIYLHVLQSAYNFNYRTVIFPLRS